jgi:hypothetical protein
LTAWFLVKKLLDNRNAPIQKTQAPLPMQKRS